MLCIGDLFCKQFELKATKEVFLPSIERKQRKSFNFASRNFRLVGEYVLNFLIGHIKNEEETSVVYLPDLQLPYLQMDKWMKSNVTLGILESVDGRKWKSEVIMNSFG